MLLAILCSLAWVAQDLLRKALVQHHKDPVTIAAMAPLGASIGCTLYVWIQGYALPAPPADGWGLFALLCVANLAGNYLFIRALFLGEISAVLPVFCLSPVVGALGAYVLMGEALSVPGMVGVCLVIAGTIAIVSGDKASSRAGVGSMLGAVVCWGMAPALDKTIINSGWSLWTYMLMALWAVTIPLMIERLIRAPKVLFSTIKASPWLMLALVPVGATALGLQLLAVLQIEVGLLEAIKRAGVVLSVALAARLFGEKAAFERLPFMLLVVGGIFLLAQRQCSPQYLVLFVAVTLALVGATRSVLKRFRPLAN
ncbi:MAG: DMT family transporter [Myxococcota bacterium]|jgi:drug/metabolite transporter (DMT)-like permease|nr:DMT family transporter [Myxococcota bacterium]